MDPLASRRTIIRLTLFMAFLLLGSGVLFWQGHSSAPVPWGAISVGSDREAVLKHIGIADSDMRGDKGFEAWKSSVTRYLGAEGRWQLLLSYSPSNVITRKEIRFMPFESKGYNEWIPAPLLYRIKTASVRQSP